MLHAIRATGEWHDYGVINRVVVIDFELDSSAVDFCGNKEGLALHLLGRPYNSTIKRARSSASQLLKFAGCETPGTVDPISAGDIILYAVENGKVSIGEIEGDYFFDMDSAAYSHCRKVKWHAADIPRPEFNSEIGNDALKGRQAVFRPGGGDKSRRLEIENRVLRYIVQRLS